MINWMCYPRNRKLDAVSEAVVKAFEDIADDIDSKTHDQQVSDAVLAKVRPGLETYGFEVEKSKKKEDLINVPVLFGQN